MCAMCVQHVSYIILILRNMGGRPPASWQRQRTHHIHANTAGGVNALLQPVYAMCMSLLNVMECDYSWQSTWWRKVASWYTIGIKADKLDLLMACTRLILYARTSVSVARISVCSKRHEFLDATFDGTILMYILSFVVVVVVLLALCFLFFASCSVQFLLVEGENLIDLGYITCITGAVKTTIEWSNHVLRYSWFYDSDFQWNCGWLTWRTLLSTPFNFDYELIPRNSGCFIVLIRNDVITSSPFRKYMLIFGQP